MSVVCRTVCMIPGGCSDDRYFHWYSDNRRLGPADELLWRNTLPGSSDLGLEETFPPASRFIIYLSRYLGSWTGPGLGCPLAWSQAQYPWPLQTALCGCHGDVCVGAHWSLSPRCGGAMGGMSWSLVMAAPASDTVPSPVLVSPHDARRWTPDAKNAHERERAKMRQHWNIIILQLRKPLKQTNKTKHDKYFKNLCRIVDIKTISITVSM